MSQSSELKNSPANIDTESSAFDKDHIIIKGARGNNLKNIDLSIPRNELVVVTGVSGSGKSSITIDTLYAEGQRRYVESLSSYIRQFLGRMKKPEVDYIKGICPAIAIEQKVSSGNARSTVGTMTEIYDFLRLLYARIGITYSPISGEIVKRHQVTDVNDFIHSLPEDTRIQIAMPLYRRYHVRPPVQVLDIIQQKGFNRLIFNNELRYIEEIQSDSKLMESIPEDFNGVWVLIDRVSVQRDNIENTQRIADSINTAFHESDGECIVIPEGKEASWFNNRFELDGIEFLEPNPQLFNYNNSFGCCRTCEGYGKIMGIDEDKVIPDKSLSIYDGAVVCWRGEKSNEFLMNVLTNAHKIDFPIHKAIKDLTKEEKKILWNGCEYFEGINQYFKFLEQHLYKIQNRVMLARFRGKTTCPECEGSRLRKETSYIKIGGKHIGELLDLPIEELQQFFIQLKLSDYDQQISGRLLLEINNRLQMMMDVGLGYLTLNRISNTLSGGETQRINLTRTLGSNLTNSMYILDEPSVGLHPRDTARLVKVLQNLRNLGNTVIVVEHEEEIIKNANYLIDMGPGAGIHGGEVVFAGPYSKIFTNAKQSITTQYLNGTNSIPIPKTRRKTINRINIEGAQVHNLKNISVTIPLNALTVISGVSGSGKTTLVKEVLHPLLKKVIEENTNELIGSAKLTGDFKMLSGLELVNQSPIGKSSRSNPVTYVKAYDAIRKLMSEQALSRIRGFEPKHFSFNVDSGRCEACQGEGEQIIEMQFLADVHLVCEDCKGQRFKEEVLEVRYHDKNIFEILELSVEEALEYFKQEKDIIKKIKPLMDVGLGYVKLGQSSSTLSGGEAQRVKLASFLSKESSSDHLFFIFDEPTTGLHFHDIRKLLEAMNALIEKGHTILIVEHNIDLIKCADWVIDLGPDAGKHGGEVVFQGTPEELINCERSFTARYLAEKLSPK